MPPHLWCKKLWMPLLLATAVFACKQKGETKPDPRVPELSYTSESALVDSGFSSQAVFSPKGDRLLFVSAKRPGHAQAQAYEKDLSTGQETRITFQNGDVYHPRYHPKEASILYSSSTDELKENPPLLRPSSTLTSPVLPAPFQDPVEVYLHSLNGLEITRVTERPGFDGEARFGPEGQTITWTRALDDKVETLSIHRLSRAVKILTKLGSNPAQYTVSPDGQWQAWVNWNASFGVAELKIQKAKAEPTEILPDFVVPKTDLEFSPDSKWLFWSQMNLETSTHQIWSYQLETSCARKITENKDGDRRHPTLSPDLRRLVYTATRKATANQPYVQSRILQVGFTAPSGPCTQAP